jgi:hypothetical protein
MPSGALKITKSTIGEILCKESGSMTAYKKVALCFSTARNSTERTKPQVIKSSMNKP